MDVGAPTVSVPERFNAASHFVDRKVSEGYGAKIAIVTDEVEVSYAEVLDKVNRAGNSLRDVQVEVENRVLLLLPDCPEFVYSFFGAMKIGAVPVPVNTLLTTADYAYILRDSRAKVLVMSSSLLPVVLPALDGLRNLKEVVVVESGWQESLPSGLQVGVTRFEDFIGRASATLEAEDTSRDDVAFWLYTSGTTGSPSAAVHLHHDMVYCADLYAKPILHLSEEDRTFSIAKMFFAYGLGNSLYFPFDVGGTTILHPGRPTPELIFDVVRRYRPTVLFGVPTSYAAMLQAVEQGGDVDMSSVRVATSAGEPLSAHLYRAWLDRFHVYILDGIGTTEILHIFISNRLDDVRPGSSGKPVPGYEVKVLDDNDRPVPTGEIGNLLVRGHSTCSQYWNRHDVTRQAIQGEWIRTRDKYHQDEDGYLWYDGRSNDMLKVGGIWVSPAEVEQAVMEHPAVLECAVVGVIDEEALVKPKAFVVLKDGNQLPEVRLAEEIQAMVKRSLAPYKYPRQVEFVSELPKTATGKIQRYKLREQLRQGNLADSDS